MQLKSCVFACPLLDYFDGFPGEICNIWFVPLVFSSLSFAYVIPKVERLTISHWLSKG